MSAAVQLELDPVPPVAPSWATSWGSLTDAARRQQRERWIELLTPIMRSLAKRRGAEGITASEVVSAGITLGVLWGEASFIERYPRVYAWVGPWLAQVARRGGLAPKVVEVPGGGQVHVQRKSERGASHRNRNGIYLDPEFASG